MKKVSLEGKELRNEDVKVLKESKTNTIVNAQVAPATEATQKPAGGIDPMLIIIPIMILAFYLLIIRPQNKKLNEQKEKISKIKKDDRVLTVGGIIGTIEKVEESEVVLRVDEKIKITFSKAAIVEILPLANAVKV